MLERRCDELVAMSWAGSERQAVRRLNGVPMNSKRSDGTELAESTSEQTREDERAAQT
jgi:hypothetical protein